MIKTINLTTLEEEALKEVYTRLLAYTKKSPSTASILGIRPIEQERIQQVLDRIHNAKEYDGRNVYTLPSNMRSAHENRAADHTPSTVAAPSAAHGDH